MNFRRGIVPFGALLVMALVRPASGATNLTFNEGIIDCGVWDYSQTAHVTRHTGAVHEYVVTGKDNGMAVVTVQSDIAILTGSYAGWGYTRSDYQLNGNTGTCYTITNPQGETNGICEGYYQGVYRADDPTKAILRLTDVNGLEVQDVLSFLHTQTTVPATTAWDNPATSIHTLSGWRSSGEAIGTIYNGPAERAITHEVYMNDMPSTDSGFRAGTWSISLGSGTWYSYVPWNNSHVVHADGPLIGWYPGSNPPSCSTDQWLLAEATMMSSGITNIETAFTSCGTWDWEDVDVRLETGGTMELQADGLLSGVLTLSDFRWTEILSGTYQGWSYRRGTYNLGNYSGEMFTIHHPNGYDVWGTTTGDIEAACRREGETATLHLAALNTMPVAGEITLEFPEFTVIPTITYYSQVPMMKRAGITFEGTASGLYNGPYQRTVQPFFLQDAAFDAEPGFTLVEVQIAGENAKGYGYFDFRNPEPLIRICADGPFYGIVTKDWPAPCEIGIWSHATLNHILGTAQISAGAQAQTVITTRAATGEVANVWLTFDQVTSQNGTAFAELVEGSTLPLPPSQNLLANRHTEISTTAAYSGGIEVCLEYDPATLAWSPDELGLIHYNEALAVWEPLASTIVTAAHRVCGTTTSLLPFGLGELACGPLVEVNSSGWPSIQTAYANADGATLKMTAGGFSENLYFDQEIALTLSGGYDCGFGSHLGRATVRDASAGLDPTLTISSGMVVVENVVLE